MKKKIITITAIFMLLYTTVAFAAVPFILSAAVRSAPSIIRGGATLLLAPAGSIPKYGSADNYGIKRNMVAKVGAAAGIAVMGYMAYNDIKSLVESHRSEYPQLYDAVTKVDAIPFGSVTDGLQVGQTVSDGDKFYNITAKSNMMSLYTTVTCSSYFGQDYYFYPSTGVLRVCVSGTKNYYDYTAQLTADPARIAADSAEFSSKVYSMSLDEIYPQYQPEIDNLMQQNPEAVQVPADLSQQVADAERQLAKDDIKTADQSRVDSLTSARDAAQAEYNSNPTAENLAKLNEAQAALDAATAQQAKDNLTNQNLTPPDNPELKQINFTPLYDLGRDLSEKFPFSLLRTIKAIADGFVTAPSAPEFSITFPAPFNHEWRFSLARWDGIAATIRFLIAATFLCCTVMTIIRRWK